MISRISLKVYCYLLVVAVIVNVIVYFLGLDAYSLDLP